MTHPSLFLSRASLFSKRKYAIFPKNTATLFPIKWSFVLVAYFTWVYFDESQFHVHATFVVNHVWQSLKPRSHAHWTHASETPRIHLKWTPRTHPPRLISIWKPRQLFLTKHACTCLINATDNIYAFVEDQRFANGLSAKSNIYLPKLGAQCVSPRDGLVGGHLWHLSVSPGTTLIMRTRRLCIIAHDRTIAWRPRGKMACQQSTTPDIFINFGVIPLSRHFRCSREGGEHRSANPTRHRCWRLPAAAGQWHLCRPVTRGCTRWCEAAKPEARDDAWQRLSHGPLSVH